MVIAFLFYRSFYGLLAGIVIIPFWLVQYRDRVEKKRQIKLKSEFKEYMILISNALQTGYSLEKALLQSEAELNKLFPKDSVLMDPIHEMNQRVRMNIQVEKAFEEMANRIEMEDAQNLSDILTFSKRAGGDYGKQIRNCAVKIEEKLRVAEDIATMTAEKQLELRVMSVMPVGILAYVALTSADFIAPLYNNIIGITIMTICLLVYGLMISIGKKIVSIEV